ncbi:hypothetical protein HOY80DRAFT_1084210 [Tuber brumale]|nr:hypothetical protein HOY80DRAFT_1084210 [Tuber brumale]
MSTHGNSRDTENTAEIPETPPISSAQRAGVGVPETSSIPWFQSSDKILKSPFFCLSTKQFIPVPHKPVSALCEHYHIVLVELYGFKDVVVPNDIVAWFESIASYMTFDTWKRL